MGDSTKYWASTMFRGSAAILAGTGVLFLPHMVSSELRNPLAPSLAMLCLAAFGVIDGVVLMRASHSSPGARTRSSVLRAHGLSGSVIGIALLGMLLGQVELRWFLGLAALQALIEAGTAMVLAAGSAQTRRARFCRVSAGISAACALALAAGSMVFHTDGGVLIDGYLCILGVNLMVLSASMLSGERSASTLTLHSATSR